jgi:hypothetical protein
MVKNFAVKMFSYCPIYANFEHTKKALAVTGQLTIKSDFNLPPCWKM